MKNIMPDWETLTSEELKEIKTSIETELHERKERQKDKAIQNFFRSFNELEELNVSVYFGDCPVRINDLCFE